jgi:DNA repair photolyase
MCRGIHCRPAGEINPSRMAGVPSNLPARGAAHNPANRFEKIVVEREDDFFDPDERPLKTEFYRDHSATIINYNDSPDIGFRASLNPYRGCEHGCIYCYARPTHEYLGFSAGLDFESRIMVKLDAAELLRRELASSRWQPQVIAMSGVTDCYQPVERKLGITRACLEVLAEFRNPVGIVTKNHLVTRDLDVLAELARHQAVVAYVSVTTLDLELRKNLEPRTSPPAARLDAIRQLSAAGIPVGVLVAPIIPAINDHEVPTILAAAAEAGARWAGYVVLRLPFAVAPLFEDWLARYFPDRKEKVLNQIRGLRDGRLNDPDFGSRMSGSGEAAGRIARLFDVAKRKAGITAAELSLSTAGFRRIAANQLELSMD